MPRRVVRPRSHCPGYVSSSRARSQPTTWPERPSALSCACSSSADSKRLFRLVGDDIPARGSTAFVVCQASLGSVPSE